MWSHSLERRSPMGFAFLGAVCVLALSACDPAWVRQSYVAPTRMAFPQCVASATAHLPELEIDSAASTSSVVVLRAKKYVFLAVSKLPDGTLLVESRGGGFNPSDEQSAYATPLLAQLTTHLAQEC
jgi:hypothetical protein